jgi:F-type H+-transporting ATPase subunit gamma
MAGLGLLRATRTPTGARGMATLKEISNRLKSVKSIEKITKSMKMVSAAKLAKAEKSLKDVRSIGSAWTIFTEKAGVEITPENDTNKLFVAICSDKGLCGGVHSAVNKHIKAALSELPAGTEAKLCLVGDKSTAVLSRSNPNDILVTAAAVGKKPPVFSESSLIAETVAASGMPYTSATVVYNWFKNAGTYITQEMVIPGPSLLENDEKMNVYEDKDESVQSFSEFQLAGAIYYAQLEGQASEQAARVSAMENASSNAADMIQALTLKFNRTRQAVITTELIEIISGAVALED